jgi:hypothetical protein
VFLDTGRTLSVIDPNRREAYICIGAFLENLSEAFEAYGYLVELTLDNHENDALCATVTYEKILSAMTKIHSPDAFLRRHGDKSAFKTAAIPENIINALILKHGAYAHYFPANSKDGQYISKTTLAAIMKQSNNQSIRDELSEWLRFSDSEAKNKKDGLPAELMGLSGIMKSLYYLMINRKSSGSDAFAKLGIIKTKTQLKGCAGFFLITGQHGKKGWIEAGMHMEAFWLDAVRHNIAINPMSAALEEAACASEISGRFAQITQNAPETRVQMILRAGIVNKYGKNAGIRRDIKDFVRLDSV